MRVLLIGNGSMSKRRQRCLKALGHNDFAVWDVTDKATIDEVAQICKPDAMIVSSPPKTKGEYIELAAKLGIPVFCEADVVSYTEGPYYPSCSLIYHPGIQKIHELLDNEALGRIYCFTYHQGMHLRDWRPKGFDFKGYYAAEHATREMFCFELSWLSYLFGTPTDATGFINKKLYDLDITADDVYSASVKFHNEKAIAEYICGIPIYPSRYDELKKQFSVIGNVLIEILSRPAIRELRIVGEKCNLLWNWNNSYISLEHPDGAVITYGYDKGKAADGYNANICEQMYIAEMQNFIDAIQNKAEYLFSRDDEKAVMDMLKKVEGK
jgi:predicted dehydrogenase